MLDVGTVRLVAGLLLVLMVAGAAALGRSVLGPRGKVVASRAPVRGSEAAWLATTLLAHAWTLGVLIFPAWFYAVPGVPVVLESSAVQVLGLSLWFVGMGLAGWAARALGRSMTVEIQVAEGQRLVQEGPYAWIRHPIYTANVTAAVGLALLYLSPPLLGLVVVIGALATYRGRLEDEFLRSPRAFGDAYTAYAERTGRFLPRLRRSGP